MDGDFFGSTDSVRRDAAALFRLVAHCGMDHLANGAIGARLPIAAGFLTHPYGMFWSDARASELVVIDADASPVGEGTLRLNDGAINTCRWIFEARPNVKFFLHGHEEEVMAVGSIEEGLMPLNRPAAYLGNLTGYIEYGFDEDETFGNRFKDLARSHDILISRNHGYFAFGMTAAEAFLRAYFLRQTCSAQTKTLSMARPLHPLPAQKVARYQDQMAASEHCDYNGATEWPGLIPLAERLYPDHKD